MIDIAKYVGIEYSHEGINCLSLVVTILNEYGYNLPFNDGKAINEKWYEASPDRLINGMKQYGKQIPTNELQPLDAVVFSFGGIPRHMGLMLDRAQFIHARQSKKSAIIKLRYYQKFLHSCWRMEVQK